MCIIKWYRPSRESERIIIKKVSLVFASILLLGILVACNEKDHVETNPLIEGADKAANQNTAPPSSENQGQLTSQFPKSTLTASTVLDSVKDTPSVRAETVTDQGTLLMISEGREELGHVVASSNYGLEGDRTFQSNYSIIFKQDNNEKKLLELPGFMYAQPDDNKLSFKKVSFKDADVYYLAPQYKTGHGLEGYFFAVDKHSGEASHLKIVNQGYTSNTLIYSEIQPFPHVENNKLLVSPPSGAGGDTEIQEQRYQLNLEKKQLVLE